jgi:Carboxypeptidase regulatory-like domain
MSAAMKTRLFQISALCALLFFPALSVYGQAVNATLLGTVTDPTGAAVPGAKITVTEVATSISHSGQTNESGNYTFPDLPPGVYTVTVEMGGFKRETRRDITLLVNSSTRADAQLQPGSVSESIEVTGAPALLETDRADTGRKLDSMTVAELPLSTNRNYQSLLNLVPGTVKANFQHSQFFNASDSLQTEVNGQTRMANNYQIEGIDDNERTGLLQVLIPPIEAIQAVDVSTSNHDAELGRASGAVTNVILKSGTNQLHGSLYEYLQNSAFDARSFFAPSVGHQSYNYFGGTVGGPIQKNRLFYFADYLKTSDHEAATQLVTVPSALARTGDLSEGTTVVYNPTTGAQDGTGTGRQPFQGNIIPDKMIDPISKKILALVPLPNLPFNHAAPTNNYTNLLPFTKDTQYTDGKIDYNVSSVDRISGRFSFQRPVIDQAPIFGAAGGPGPGGAFQGTGVQKTYSTGINWNHIFSPTFLVETRVGVAHYHNAAQQSDFGTTAATSIGIPGINVSEFTSGMVGVNGPFSNPMVGYSASLPWIRAEANIDFVNNWTKIYGNHSFKFGFDMRRLRDDLLQTQTYSPRGLYSFGTSQTGNPADSSVGWANTMGSLLLDLPNSGSGRDFSIVFPTFRAWQFFMYAGDKWQVNNKLTLDIGLRWELYPPGVPAFPGEFSNFNPAADTFVIAGVGNNPMNLGLQNHKGYFAPRLGIAYRLTEKTVIRTGFGMSYTPFPDNKYAWDNFPVKGNVGLTAVGKGFGPALLPNGQPASFATGIPVPPPVAIPSNGILDASNTLGSNWETIPLDYKNPYVEAWNFSIQQALPFHFTLDAAYVGNHGVRSPADPNINAATVLGQGTKGQPLFPRTGSVTEFWQGFSSMYNALQVKLDRRYNSGLSITTSFTYGKGMGFMTAESLSGSPMFYIDFHRNWARNDQDRTFTFVQSYVYDLPFGQGKRWMRSGPMNTIAGGWKISGILTAMSGLPFNITFSGTSLAAPGNTNTPNVVGAFTVLHGINVGHPWFDPTAFAPGCTAVTAACPNGPQFGNVGRNEFSGPGFFSLDATLSKQTRITERIGMQLRLEAFSVTNTPDFSNPSGGCCTANNANFGVVTSVVGSGSGVINGTGGGQRYIQLAAKVTF